MPIHPDPVTEEADRMLLRKTSFGLRVLVAAGLLTLGLTSAGQAETLKIG